MTFYHNIFICHFHRDYWETLLKMKMLKILMRRTNAKRRKILISVASG